MYVLKISIPRGAVKRICEVPQEAQCFLFQFQEVQLKERKLTELSFFFIQFQFQEVQLKGALLLCCVPLYRVFQFQEVQLKVYY